ncbi:MAG: hypothetical protein ACRD07_19110 [Acidimicrobiales bacterium]
MEELAQAVDDLLGAEEMDERLLVAGVESLLVSAALVLAEILVAPSGMRGCSSPALRISAWSMWLAPATMATTRVTTLRPGRAPPTRPESGPWRSPAALQFEANVQRPDQQQPGVGHQVRLVEAHPDPVNGMRCSTH